MMAERQSRITQISEPEPQDDDGEVLELTEEAGEEDGGDAEQPGEAETKESVFVQIGDEEPEEVEQAPDWVKDLRRTNREQARRIKELEEAKGPAEKPKLGARPTREGCDYDDAEYDRQLDAWYARKAEVEAAEQEQEQAQKRAQDRWQAKLDKLAQDKADLGAEDIEEAEEVVRETLNVTQQGIIAQGAANAALVFYALGKNPSKAKELATIDDPVEFAFAIARMETQLKTGKRAVPPPEGTPRIRTGTGSSITDNTLEKLRAEAERTNDYSKVAAYRRSKRAAK